MMFKLMGWYLPGFSKSSGSNGWKICSSRKYCICGFFFTKYAVDLREGCGR